jgi:hypothetical protein
MQDQKAEEYPSVSDRARCLREMPYVFNLNSLQGRTIVQRTVIDKPRIVIRPLNDDEWSTDADLKREIIDIEHAGNMHARTLSAIGAIMKPPNDTKNIRCGALQASLSIRMHKE